MDSLRTPDELAMKQHFVTFYSPGTFVSETTSKEIDSWDVEKAQRMASQIVERYGATPYGFRFSTRGRAANELDSREIECSGMYFMNGRVRTLEQVKARQFPKECTLITNMEVNDIAEIVEKRPEADGYQWTFPLNKGDVVLP